MSPFCAALPTNMEGHKIARRQGWTLRPMVWHLPIAGNWQRGVPPYPCESAGHPTCAQNWKTLNTARRWGSTAMGRAKHTATTNSIPVGRKAG